MTVSSAKIFSSFLMKLLNKVMKLESVLIIINFVISYFIFCYFSYISVSIVILFKR
jgi:hypothetical protein